MFEGSSVGIKDLPAIFWWAVACFFCAYSAYRLLFNKAASKLSIAIAVFVSVVSYFCTILVLRALLQVVFGEQCFGFWGVATSCIENGTLPTTLIIGYILVYPFIPAVALGVLVYEAIKRRQLLRTKLTK